MKSNTKLLKSEIPMNKTNAISNIKYDIENLEIRWLNKKSDTKFDKQFWCKSDARFLKIDTGNLK